jgi:tetratricopeptide (TPR) repeat protein
VASMEDFDIVQRKRDRQLVEVVRQYLLIAVTFRNLYEKYQEGSLRFSDWAKFVDDRGDSILFSLKKNTQELFQPGPFVISEKEQIFDLTIRSIFHLAMKMREDLYQIEMFAPKYSALSKKDPVSSEREKLIHKFHEILLRAETSFREGMEEIAILAQDSFRQFKDLLSEYRENGLLLRFFIEEPDLIKKATSQASFEECLLTLSGKDEAEAYRVAGESYFESAFYDRATAAFSRALEKNPGDYSLQLKIHLSRGMEQFYSFALLEALQSFEKCLSLCRKVEIVETYRAMIRKVCQKIQEDFPGRRKNDMHRELTQKAKTLKRKMEELPPASSDLYPT